MKPELWFVLPVILVFVGMIGIIVGVFGYQEFFGKEQTGVCLFKGPFIAPGFFFGSGGSDGIPIRYVNVSIWRTYPLDEPGPTYVTQGLTDRMGCFSFQAEHGFSGFADYKYNGTEYTDSLVRGAMLRDNLA